MGIPYVQWVSFGLKSYGLAMVVDQMQVKFCLNKSPMLQFCCCGLVYILK